MVVSVQDAKIGTPVLGAYAVSRNVGQPPITYSLVHMNGRNDFRIGPTSGEVQTNAELDYDAVNDYLVSGWNLMQCFTL